MPPLPSRPVILYLPNIVPTRTSTSVSIGSAAGLLGGSDENRPHSDGVALPLTAPTERGPKEVGPCSSIGLRRYRIRTGRTYGWVESSGRRRMLGASDHKLRFSDRRRRPTVVDVVGSQPRWRITGDRRPQRSHAPTPRSPPARWRTPTTARSTVRRFWRSTTSRTTGSRTTRSRCRAPSNQSPVCCRTTPTARRVRPRAASRPTRW